MIAVTREQVEEELVEFITYPGNLGYGILDMSDEELADPYRPMRELIARVPVAWFTHLVDILAHLPQFVAKYPDATAEYQDWQISIRVVLELWADHNFTQMEAMTTPLLHVPWSRVFVFDALPLNERQERLLMNDLPAMSDSEVLAYADIVSYDVVDEIRAAVQHRAALVTELDQLVEERKARLASMEETDHAS